MKQISFSDAEFNSKARVTRRERFLDDMSRVVPFARLQALIEPHYALKSKGNGNKGSRPARGVALMLRLYFLQQWFGRSDEGLEGSRCLSLPYQSSPTFNDRPICSYRLINYPFRNVNILEC